jgi:hypothetical protein
VQNISIGLDVALVAGETDIEIHRGRHIVDHIVCRQSYVDAVASLAKSRMNFINAGVFDRKSGCTLVRTWGTVQNHAPWWKDETHWESMHEKKSYEL